MCDCDDCRKRNDCNNNNDCCQCDRCVGRNRCTNNDSCKCDRCRDHNRCDCLECSGNGIIKKFNHPGNILISDQFNNRVIETNSRGEIVWSYGLGPSDFTPNSIIAVNDAERIRNKTLMVGTGTPTNIDNRVILVNKHGQIIWQYGQFGLSGTGFDLLDVPVQATFVPFKKCKKSGGILDGTILITDQANNRIIEVNEAKQIIRTYTAGGTLSSPNSAQKLCNKNILIADEGNNRAIEVNKLDQIIATYTANGTLGACAFASRLCNGNTLLTDAGNNRIVEVNVADHIIWQYITNADPLSIPAPSPSRGLRLKNGNTIISDQFNNRVIIINQTATILDYYGLPLVGGPGPIGTNFGYDLNTTQLGLYSPYDAKVIGDYTGLTKP